MTRTAYNNNIPYNYRVDELGNILVWWNGEEVFAWDIFSEEDYYDFERQVLDQMKH